MGVFVVVELMDGKDTTVRCLRVDVATGWGMGDGGWLAVYSALRFRMGSCGGADLGGNGLWLGLGNVCGGGKGDYACLGRWSHIWL